MKVYNSNNIPKFEEENVLKTPVKKVRLKNTNKSFKKSPRFVKKQKTEDLNVISNKERFQNILKILAIPFIFIWQLISIISDILDKIIPRSGFVKFVGITSFVVIIFSFFNIFNQSAETLENKKKMAYTIIPARRGNIYIHNATAGKDVSLTSSQLVSTITINPSYLKQNINKKILNKEEIVTKLAAELNLPWNEINDLITKEIKEENPKLSVILKKNATAEQGKAVQNLRESDAPERFRNWIRHDPIEDRSYNLMGQGTGSAIGSITGYVQKQRVPRSEVEQNNRFCYQMVLDNEDRGTVNSYDGTNEHGEYVVGYYGVEQVYCSELGGLNGRQSLGGGVDENSENKVQNGADIYLTLDSNLQAKAQEVLDGAIQTNVSKLTGKPPRDGLVMVMSLEKTETTEPGEILAMASYPYADPNKYFDLRIKESAGFINTALRPYEAGSVLKPLTVAAAHDVWFKEAVNDKGERIGLDPGWNWTAYPPVGKPFPIGNGEVDYISNAMNETYAGEEKSLKNCLRRSINTCLADIEQRISNSVQDILSGNSLSHAGIISYFRDKLLIGKPRLVNFASPGTSDTSAFDSENKVDVSAANWSFGQGFRLTPIELARAYSALGRNDGTVVEPYIVQKTVYDNGKVNLASDPNSPLNLYRGEPKKVFDERAVKLVQDYMVYTLDQYGAAARTPAINGYVNGYPIAAKTGTAQVSIQQEEYKEICKNYDSPLACSLGVGIYDQTYIGYGPVGENYKGKPKFLVLIKLSEPRVGEKNYFGIAGLGQYFSQMFDYTLSYYGVPKDPSR